MLNLNVHISAFDGGCLLKLDNIRCLHAAGDHVVEKDLLEKG